MPLVGRIHEIKVPVIFVCMALSLSFRPTRPLITTVDGDTDWMDPKGGVQSVEALRKAGNGRGKMYLVKNAGHHGMFLSHAGRFAQ
jgi:cardiolipin-specific phospholipase